MKELLNYLNKLLCEGDILIVGVSGGADSMFLLEMLMKVKKSKNITIVVAHVNHKLRVESEEEALFVESFSKENNLIYEYMEIKEYNHDNLENEARIKRYDFFDSLVNKHQAKYLMTAHHGDDLIETVLMRLVRGSNIRGYSGFKKEVQMNNYKIIRPLITFKKTDILEYMMQNKLKYYDDVSNESMKYTRNRYRKKILPILKEENTNVHLKFLKFSKELSEASEFIAKYLNKLSPYIKDKYGLKISELKKLDDFLVRKVIENELEGIYNNDLFLINDKHVKEINDLISKPENKMINLPKGYVAVKDYDHLYFEKDLEKEEFNFVLDKEVVGSFGTIRVVQDSDDTSNNVIRLNSRDIKLPIIIRNKVEGDRIQVKNLGGTKKVKDIFRDEKVNLVKRRHFPIVTDSENKILWLPGVKKSNFDIERYGIYDIILLYEEEE